MSNKINLSPFHSISVPVHDLTLCRNYLQGNIGYEKSEGRSSDKWVDFNFFGHQFVIHETGFKNELNNNYVDGHGVPVPHFMWC